MSEKTVYRDNNSMKKYEGHILIFHIEKEEQWQIRKWKKLQMQTKIHSRMAECEKCYCTSC